MNGHVTLLEIYSATRKLLLPALLMTDKALKEKISDLNESRLSSDVLPHSKTKSLEIAQIVQLIQAINWA